jgi:hypothetical protein
MPQASCHVLSRPDRDTDIALSRKPLQWTLETILLVIVDI